MVPEGKSTWYQGGVMTTSRTHGGRGRKRAPILSDKHEAENRLVIDGAFYSQSSPPVIYFLKVTSSKLPKQCHQQRAKYLNAQDGWGHLVQPTIAFKGMAPYSVEVFCLGLVPHCSKRLKGTEPSLCLRDIPNILEQLSPDFITNSNPDISCPFHASARR